jgi:chromosome segregation ATPase
LKERTQNIQRSVAQIEADQRVLSANVNALRDSLTEQINTVRDSLGAKIDAVKDSVASLAERVAAFDGKIAAMESSIIKWMVGTMIAVAALAFTIAKFVK